MTRSQTPVPKNCGAWPNPTVCPADRKMFNPNVNASNNRLSSSDGYQFDAAGNTVRNAQLRKFTYDAENTQTRFVPRRASRVNALLGRGGERPAVFSEKCRVFRTLDFGSRLTPGFALLHPVLSNCRVFHTLCRRLTRPRRSSPNPQEKRVHA